MLDRSSSGPKRVRTLFLSDVHLGTRGCQAERLLDFLRHYETTTLYLVGDIVDGWQLKSGWYWPQSHKDVVHAAADGKRYLVIHGDLFDVVIRHARWLALLGNKAYDIAIWLNTHFNAVRRAFGLTYWSLSQWAKLKVKNAVNFIGEFEQTIAAEARRRGLDGVVCGHIHHAVIRNQPGFCYINCGDWI